MVAVAPYRPEVDGLRALAVVPVILFHAGVPSIAGGFLGVDIFFVISGYLITRILYSDLQVGQFSILKFYERRARRILPALFVVMAFTIPFAMLWMPPDALSSYFRSLIAAGTFWSNIHFWLASGYFSPNADEQPLLHTWSLAVEEQFYVVFPLLLWFLWRQGHRLGLLLVGLLVLGLAVCVFQTTQNNEIAFYLLHARAWELLAGTCLAIAERKCPFWMAWPVGVRAGLAGGGALVTIAAIFMGSSHWLTPLWPNVIVVVGTVALLAFATGDTFTGRILSTGPVVAIGLVSYSAYLWHHPLFAFARLRSLDEPVPWVMFILVGVTFGLAWLTWLFVERPFRRAGFMARSQVLAASGMAIAAFVAFGVFALVQNLSRWRLTPEQLTMVLPPMSQVEDCAWQQPVNGEDRIAFCAMGQPIGKETGVLLWGDSHAGALYNSLSATLAAKGQSGSFLKSHRCLRISGVVLESRRTQAEEADCARLREALYAYLKLNPPKAIVLSMRWTLRLSPVTGASTVGFDNGEGGVEAETARTNWVRAADGGWTLGDEAKIEAVAAFIARLSEVAPVVVVGPVPEVGWHVGNRNFKSVVVNGMARPEISTSFERFKVRNAVALRGLDAAALKASFKRVEPAEIFCNSFVAGRCVAQAGSVAYYSDDDHVSETGAELIVAKVMQALGL